MADNEMRKALRDFAITRSCNAATAANDNSRPMAQAALLINGGAATAVIAFLTKDKIEPSILQAIPWTLVLYGAGVVSGALGMYFMTECLDYWNVYWEKIARNEPQNEIDEQEAFGQRWWGYTGICFFASIGFFIAGSVILAIGIGRIPLPPSAIGGPG